MNILINRTDALGDTLLTMPMAQALKKKFSHAKIAFIVSKRVAPLLRHHLYIDDFFIYSQWRLLLKDMASFKADAYFHCGGSFIPTLLALTLGIPFRGGLKSRWPSFFLLNKGVRQSRSKSGKHESEYNLELLAPLGVDTTLSEREDYAPSIHLTKEEDTSFLKDFKEELQKNGFSWGVPMIFIHPGMTGHSLGWPSENYAEFVEKIEGEHPKKFLFVISHTPRDRPYLPSFGQKVFYFDGSKRGLRYYLAVLSKASLLVAPSTGNTHMANVFGIPQIAFYSPLASQSSRRWGPFHRGDHVVVMQPSLTYPINECMSSISVDSVYQKALQLLQRFV